MVAPRFAKLFAVASSAAFVCSMVGVPAYALTDTNLDEGTTGTSTGVSATPVSTDESPSLQGQPSADQVESMPDNPTKDLPQTVSEEIPDDATVVSEELAVTDDGEVMDLETGDTVTDPQIVGTVDKPADPLAKTDGESFIPVEVAEVKDAMGDTATAPEPDDATDVADTEDAEDDGDVAESQQDAADEGATGAVVRPAALQNNSYGAYWGTYNGTPAFFEADGTLFVQQAKGVIDVSEWQGQIDWQKAKNDGVEGAIIRISYGWDNGFDKQALRNISECKRLGIPFGIYSYSYAYDSMTAAYEGNDMVNLLRQAGVQPNDLSYPVFYDLEKWTWTGHTPPTSPSVYDGIVNAWYAKLQAAGYNNLSVYSYTNYLDTALNSANIRNKTRWVASYGARTNFPFAANDRGWQYTSQGSVAGIQGSVDLNAFGNKTYDGGDVPSPAVEFGNWGTLATDLSNGYYIIVSALSSSEKIRVVDIANAEKSNKQPSILWPFTNSDNQIFYLQKNNGIFYSIRAKHSGRYLDAEGPSSENGTRIIQFDGNCGMNQQWVLYRDRFGWYYIVSAYSEGYNKVLDVTGGLPVDGSQLELWPVNGGTGQRFRLVPVSEFVSAANGWRNGHWYVQGFPVKEAEVFIEGKWRWFNSDGRMVVNQDVWVPSNGGKWVHYGADGGMVYGEQYYNSAWYFLDYSTGKMAHGVTWVNSNGGKWVYYDINTGRMQYGEQYLNYDDEHTGWYHFDTITGAMSHGFVYLSGSDKWVYYDRITGIMQYGEQYIDGGWYYFDSITGAIRGK